MEQRLARQAHNLEVVGSIPAGATFPPPHPRGFFHAPRGGERLPLALDSDRPLPAGAYYLRLRSLEGPRADVLLLVARTRLMLETTRNLVEPAGAAPVAALLADPERFAGRRVAVICSGGNIAPAQLAALLQESR